MRCCQTLFLILSLCLILSGSVLSRGLDVENKSLSAIDTQAVIMPDDLRHVAVHDAGKLYTPFYDGFYSLGFSGSPAIDPESGDTLNFTTYPANSQIEYIFMGGIWVGGIVNNDTLVSTMHDGWAGPQEMSPYNQEMFPNNPDVGGTHRTGDFADDEFVTVITDKMYEVYEHTPLNLEITQKSYSWADTLFDDFILVDYTVTNVGDESITDGWVGILLDADVFHLSSTEGYQDDCSGLLDTLLDENDPSSRAFIAYSFDNDGDPETEMLQWGETSPRGAISLRILGADFDVDNANFNWWISNGSLSLDFGPRRLGTPEDPFYEFTNGALGTAGSDADRYFLLSHPEVDYDQLFTAIDHSAEGWLPPPLPNMANDFSDGYDTRFLLSCGPFDVPAGESVTFTVALVAGDNLHVNGSDFNDYFDADNPTAYYQTLDFSELLLHHKRAEEVYQSGYTLANPGLPVGLAITAFDDTFVDLSWYASARPDLAGYNIYYRDTEGDNVWYKVNLSPIANTSNTIPITMPLHLHEFAVTIVNDIGQESVLSDIVSLVPNTPHTVTGVESIVQGLNIAVQWDWNSDSDIEYYLVYRSTWNGEFEKLDSTAQDYFIDVTTESGVKYNYYIVANNFFGNESLPSEIVSEIPMAMDKGVLFIDHSSAMSSSAQMPFNTNEFMELYTQVASRLPAELHQTMADGYEACTFKKMADYSHLVVILEGRSSSIKSPISEVRLDSIALFMQNGGSVIITASNAGFEGTTDKTYRYSPGDIEYDIFKMDSCVSRNFVYDGLGVHGDLAGCVSLNSEYDSLTADMTKLVPQDIFVDFLPATGFLFPREDAEPLFTYESSVPDTINSGQINGIRYLGEDYKFVLLNFPLTLMRSPENYRVLLQALKDIGVDVYCGDANDDGNVNLGDAIYLIQYTFFGGSPPVNMGHADINCDGHVNMGDVVGLINYIFRDHALLNCCP
ncbi:MAG: hypothetical protein KAR42_10185 [candidate division Zixibacteria bacterium]|nr:hypothetical protein [candidate division Zixibacteria bacterium]